MHHQRGLSVELLHLIRSHQVSHAHGPPASLALPQHCVQSREQSSDVPLLSLDPVQDLPLSKRPTLSQTEHCVVHVLILFFFSFFHLPVISVDPFLWSSLVFSFQRWSSVPSCRSWTQSPEWTAGLRSRPPSPLVLGLLYNTERTLSMYMCV